MKQTKQVWVRSAAFALAGVAIGLTATRLRAVPQEAPNLAPSAPMTAFTLSAQPPQGAILLFTGKPEQITNNFYKRYSTRPADWTVDAQGVATPMRDDITTRQEFGDSYVHAEFRCSLDANGKSIGEGNSGVGMQGRYEVQILDSYGHKPSPVECGAFYSEKSPLVNPSKKPGEWQTFDIIFRAPRFDANGQITEKPRATVFMNGVLVQNNEEFTGMTGIQYGEYKQMTKTGPIVLQGDHSPVQFRNVWIVPLSP